MTIKKYFILLPIFGFFMAQAQLDDKVVLEQMDNLDLGFGDKEVKLSQFYSGDPIEQTAGSFLKKNREEYLCVVPVRQGDQNDKVAFVVYRATDGKSLGVSTWMAMRFSELAAVDIEGDGMMEIKSHVQMPGNRIVKEALRIFSLEGDVQQNLYGIDGFKLSEEATNESVKGAHISRKFTVVLDDMDGDGVLELQETVKDDFFQFSDDNGNNEFEPWAQRKLTFDDNHVIKTYVWKKGKFELVEERLGY